MSRVWTSRDGYSGKPLPEPPEPEDRPLSADDQLDTDDGLRGIPLIGAGPGAIRYTRPESCISKLDRLADLLKLSSVPSSA